MLSPRLALVAAALLLAPAAAFTDGRATRDASASVASDANAYLKAVTANPALNLANAYSATLATLTHHHASPAGQATTLDVTVTKTAGAARFAVTPATSTSVARDGSMAVTVTDTSALHTPIVDTVTVRVDAVVKVGISNVGFVSFSRSVTVTV